LGQNFLADTNLLEAIVRDARLAESDVVLEVGGGEGALTELLAMRAAHVHVIELDERLREPLEEVAGEHHNVSLHFGDALEADLAGLDPAPAAMVSNLPYSVATPLLIRTIAELPGLETWTVMVQREIAERLRAAPGSRVYGSPSVMIQLACRVELLRKIDRAVFRPRPRVDSALLRLERVGPGADKGLERLVRGAFAHRRKALPRSLELAGVAGRPQAAAALEDLGLAVDSRAEALAPEDFRRLREALA
jgi:16S rRNA (adenine1518-N6/adenine1519-N6)-dimethyltransferase